MLPETGDAGRIELYRAVEFPDHWELDRVLIDGLTAFDATLHCRGRAPLALRQRGRGSRRYRRAPVVLVARPGRRVAAPSGEPDREGMRPAPGRPGASSGARERSSGRARTVPAATARRSCCTGSTCCRRRPIGKRRWPGSRPTGCRASRPRTRTRSIRATSASTPTATCGVWRRIAEALRTEPLRRQLVARLLQLEPATGRPPAFVLSTDSDAPAGRGERWSLRSRLLIRETPSARSAYCRDRTGSRTRSRCPPPSRPSAARRTAGTRRRPAR